MRAISAVNLARSPEVSVCANSSSTWRANSSGAEGMNEDLDARLEEIVAPAELVVDA